MNKRNPKNNDDDANEGVLFQLRDLKAKIEEIKELEKIAFEQGKLTKCNRLTESRHSFIYIMKAVEDLILNMRKKSKSKICEENPIMDPYYH